MQVLSHYDIDYHNHRGDVTGCPKCKHEMTYGEWVRVCDKIITDSTFFKAANFVCVTECPECFNHSWMHIPISFICQIIDGNNEVVDQILVAEKKYYNEQKNNWLTSACYHCSLLTSTVNLKRDYAHCHIGSGPTVKSCSHFKKK